MTGIEQQEDEMKNSLLIILILTFSAVLASCSSASSTADGDSDNNINPDGDSDDYVPPDGDEDGDIDGITIDGDDDAAELDRIEDAIEDDPDEELYLPEFDADPEPEIECGSISEPCLPGWAIGQEGYKCSGKRLVHVIPKDPEPPYCQNECDFENVATCPADCIDPGDGQAYCEDSELDGDAVEDDGIETDGDSIDIDDFEQPDGDSTDIPGEDDSDTIEDDGWQCVPDSFEPNEGLAGAIPLSGGYYEGYTICVDDQDWFWLYLVQGDELTVRIDFTNANGDLNLFLRNESGSILQSSTSENQDYEEVSITAAQSQTFYFFVTSYGGMDNEYNISIDHVVYLDGDEEVDFDLQEPDIDKDITTPCSNDLYEPNNTLSDAISIGPTNLNALYVCPDEQDWFAIDLLATDNFHAEIHFQQFYADLAFKLYGPDGTHLATSLYTVDGYRELNRYVTQTGTHYLLVYARDDGDEVAYTLETTVQHNTAGCTDDAYENNDDDEHAATLTDGDYDNLMYCAYDYDWYAFDMLAGETLELGIYFPHASINIDAELYNNAGEMVDYSNSMNDNEYLYYHTETDTTVFAFLYGMGYKEHSYDLSVNLGVFEGCNEDPYEDNDTVDAPHPIEIGNYPYMAACPDDPDYLSFEVEGGNQITATALSDSPDYMLMRLFNPASEQVKNSMMIDGGRILIYQAAAGGTYTLGVEAQWGSSFNYDVDINICPEDAFEENDNYIKAIFVPQSTNYPDMAICRGDQDWFAYQQWQGTQVTILLQYQYLNGDLDMYLRDVSGNILKQSTTQTNTESIQFTAPASATYYIQVIGYGDAQNAYSISFSL